MFQNLKEMSFGEVIYYVWNWKNDGQPRICDKSNPGTVNVWANKHWYQRGKSREHWERPLSYRAIIMVAADDVGDDTALADGVKHSPSPRRDGREGVNKDWLWCLTSLLPYQVDTQDVTRVRGWWDLGGDGARRSETTHVPKARPGSVSVL